MAIMSCNFWLSANVVTQINYQKNTPAIPLEQSNTVLKWEQSYHKTIDLGLKT